MVGFWTRSLNLTPRTQNRFGGLMDQTVRSAYVDVVERQTLDENRYRVTIAAREDVRQPPVLEFAGLSTENYAKNPVVMWAHDVVGRSPSAGLPIGRTLKLTKPAAGTVVADFEFLSEDPFAQRVKNAWDKGFLRAASISWLPLEGAPADDGRWRDTRSELLEWSLVAVPADPDALREAHRRMMAELLRGAASYRKADRGGVVDIGDRRASGAIPDGGLREIGEAVDALRAALYDSARGGGKAMP